LLAVFLVAACHPQHPAGGVAALPPPIANTDPIGAQIDAAANAEISKGTAMGLSVAVARHGVIDWAKGYGLADQAAHTPAGADTVYRIGSLTKQFTAAAIVQLSEAHQLALTDDISKYVPGVFTAGNHVTIEQLLHHTSGIPNYTDQPSFQKIMNTHLAPADIVALVKDVKWDFPPGTKFNYSNTGYVVLGMIIEKVSGESYASYLAGHVFSAAGLRSTSYCDESKPDPHRALGYAEDEKTKGLALAPPVDLSTPFSAGAICSTVTDLLRWDAALAGGRVVSPAGYKAMTTSHGLPDHPYGFGLVIAELKGHRVIWHNGGINGFVSELHDYVDDGLTIAVLANTESPAPKTVEHAIAAAALGLASDAAAISATDLAAYAGTFDVQVLGDVVVHVEQTPEGAALMLSPLNQPTFTLEYRGNDTFALDEVGAMIKFTRDDGTKAVTEMAITQSGTTVSGKKK
jgi:CubicO group peptidase (beta-lactamase class C family)